MKRIAMIAASAAALALTAGACSSSSSKTASAGGSNTSTTSEASTRASSSPGDTAMLEHPKIWIVYSSVDDDAQLLVNAGATEPMVALTVTGPGGVVIHDLRFHDEGKIGQADVTLEGPEPKLGQLEAAFPAGTYTFAATTVSGKHLKATSTLSRQSRTTTACPSPTPPSRRPDGTRHDNREGIHE